MAAAASTDSKKTIPVRMSNEDKLFWWIAAFSLVVRGIVLALVWNAPLTADAQDYLAMAHRLLAGDHFVPYWPPGLPFYLLPTVALGGSSGLLRLSMLLFWLLLIAGLYRLGHIAGIQKWSWKILLVFSITPAAVHLSVEPLTQLPVAALFVVALGSLLCCMRGAGRGEYVVLGTTIGIMGLIRPSALVLCLLVLIPAFRTRRFSEAVGSFVLIAAICGGWMLKAHEISGGWTFNTSNTRNLWYGNNPSTPFYRTWYFGSHAKPGSPELNDFPAYKQELANISKLGPFEQQARFKFLAERYIQQHPGAFLLRTVNRFRCFWAFDTFTSLNWRRYVPRALMPSLALECITYLVLMVPAFFCIGAAGASFWKNLESWIIMGAVILYAAPYWISMSHPTYHFPVVVPLAVAGAVASQTVSGRGNIYRGLLAIFALMMIQAEWVWVMRAAA